MLVLTSAPSRTLLLALLLLLSQPPLHHLKGVLWRSILLPTLLGLLCLVLVQLLPVLLPHALYAATCNSRGRNAIQGFLYVQSLIAPSRLPELSRALPSAAAGRG